ncbi:ribosomal protein S5 domain 2-type protein [Zychaea mexicana]|uniref:ribosomal protein S5 domain 2-type protein n=1 Tax=Zychaea mexicana TaxID=64656 RepID=UPI0022FE16F0|nr:ribosomal protein S5 domain 2-type protein [Zychaea mexicana]KAI9496810.1 ribosomal protein S5 domain 2-type protein [Zychaea mexicana]
MTQGIKRALISAPGKVILFGEHAVVHKKLAVAASLGLRTYLHLEENDTGKCRLHLPDVDIDLTWALSDLTLDVDRVTLETGHPMDIPEEIKKQFEKWMGVTQREAQRQAVLAFLYLFFVLKTDKPTSFGFTISTRSTLPVGAGLGSSASFATCISTALLVLFHHIPVGFAQSEKRESHLDTVNRYAYKAEQVIHGNPSGLDNSVCTFGGALSFRRGERFVPLEGFQSLQLLLTNTKVPRSTSALVAGVTAKKEKYPQVIDPILESIDNISLRCCEAFKRSNKDSLAEELEDLVDMNHCLLHALGVSHGSLEKVRSVTGEYGVKTKLTGAGGGGCALSIIRDDVNVETTNLVAQKLAAEGFDCYRTSLGGSGVNAVVLDNSLDQAWLMSADRETLEMHAT